MMDSLANPRIHGGVFGFLYGVIVAVGSGLNATIPTNAWAASGDYSIDFAAAAPDTYNHLTGGGSYDDRMIGAQNDVVESLDGGDFACGDIVTYFATVTVDDVLSADTDAPQTIEMDFSFLADTTGQSGVAMGDIVDVAVNYGAIHRWDVDRDGIPDIIGDGPGQTDGAMIDDGGSTATLIAESLTGPLFQARSELLGTVRLTDLERNEQVVVRIDVKLFCDPGSDPTGNLQGALSAARLTFINGTTAIDLPEALPGGEQTIPFKQIADVALPVINVEKTVTTADGTCGADDLELLTVTAGDTVKYCYVVANPSVTNQPGGAPLYTVTLKDDNGTPLDTSDDFPVSLSGLTDQDEDGVADDLAAGGTAAGEALVVIEGPVFGGPAQTIISTATAAADDSIILPKTLTATDTATVVAEPPPVVVPDTTVVKGSDANADGTFSGTETAPIEGIDGPVAFQETTTTCSSPPNPIIAENCLPGNPASEWDVSGAGDPSIQGFATQLSVDRSDTLYFKVATSASSYRIDMYRLGYYSGLGARKVATVLPSVALPQSQPNCLSDPATGLIDCGNWSVSASWTVPPTAVSGIYLARLVRPDTGGASHIVFVVRDDANSSDLLFQTSDTTWQAYNDYGGNSLYTGSPAGRAYKVSYNRPFNTRSTPYARAWLFGSEYPMVRWLESNGYHVSYFTGVDSDRFGGLLRNHKAFLSVGHDEYWSGGQRANVEAARNAGVHLSFFSGNEVFWKTRWENSIDESATPHRTLVSYKETHAGAKIDPQAAWTGTWRDPRFSPPADGGRPENALTGTIFTVNCCDASSPGIQVPSVYRDLRFWRDTSIATLLPGQTATLAPGTLGYEWDEDLDNGFRPAGLFRMSSTTVGSVPVLQDYGSNYASAIATHSLTLYRHASGALVFGAGTIRWSWGLDGNHDVDSATPNASTTPDIRMQQATVNLLADMGAQPGTLQPGLVAAVASSDSLPPSSTITTPAAGAPIQSHGTITISGTAADMGGGVVAGVEVSVDGGTTWHPAAGGGNWTYKGRTPRSSGVVSIKSRAVDDSGNLETPGPGIGVTVVSGSATCPCTIWPTIATPQVESVSEAWPIDLGIQFTSEVNGFITGIRFYKGSGNTGTHVGNLWTSGGELLATANFTNETATGWQQVDFDTPVAITANTVYVASYFAPNGGYAFDNAYFASAGVDSPPLHALRDGVIGGNGVFAYSATSTFPNSTYQATNYWVDAVFTTSTPPTVTTTSPGNGATGFVRTANIAATFSEAMDPASINTTTFLVKDAAGNAVPAAVSYSASSREATLNPVATLSYLTTYTATIRSGDSGVKDVSGIALAADRVWSFTTVADTTAPTVTSVSPRNGATGVSRTTNITATFSEAMNPATISASTVELRDATSTVVQANITYSTTNNRVTIDPIPRLSGLKTYSVTIRSGAAGVKSAQGNALATDRVWSFTTRSK